MSIQTKKAQSEEKRLEKEFSRAKIPLWKLVPVNILQQIKKSGPTWTQSYPLLPLEWFDDRIFEDLKVKFEQIQASTGQSQALAFLPKWSLSVLESAFNRSSLSLSSFGTTNASIESGFSVGRSLMMGGHKSNIFCWTRAEVFEFDCDNQVVKVKDLITGEIYELPLIYVKFFHDSDVDFVEQVQRALGSRDEAEMLIKYRLFLDCIPVEEELPKRLTQKVSKLMGKVGANHLKELLIEVAREYQMNQLEIDIWSSLKQDPTKFPDLPLLKEQPRCDPWRNIKIKIDYDFEEGKKHFNWLQIYTFPAIYNCLRFVIDSCKEVAELSLYLVEKGVEVDLETFDLKQKEHVDAVKDYLHTWPTRLIGGLNKRLSRLKETWFDVKFKTWDVYLMSKLYRLLQLIKFHVQNAIR